MSVKLGSEMKLYYCAAGIGGSPSWTELAIIGNVKLSMPWDETEIKLRSTAPWVLTIATFVKASVEFEILWDADNSGLQAIRDAWLNRTAIGLAVLDGPIDQAGSQGLWADCAILKFDRDEQLEKEATVSVTAKPTYSANVPQWKVIGA